MSQPVLENVSRNRIYCFARPKWRAPQGLLILEIYGERAVLVEQLVVDPDLAAVT
jgi:hypothetical protein